MLVGNFINFKNKKKHLEMSSFYTSEPKIMIIRYTVPDIWHLTDVYNCYFSFWAISFPFTPLTCLKNDNLKKMKKTAGGTITLHMYQKLWLDDVRFLRNGAQQTDNSQIDGKSDTEVGAPPKKYFHSSVLYL